MIQTEIFGTRRDGTVLIRTYSDTGCHITRDGEIYEEAIDPRDSGRSYTETDIPLITEEEEVL
jgi:hypothetical protein